MAVFRAELDRNLLFGVLALQVDLLDQTRFVEACAAWAARKNVSLPELVVEHGWLTPDACDEVERLVARKLQKHGGDPQASLAAALGDVARQSVAAVADPDLRQSLAAAQSQQPREPAATGAYVPDPKAQYGLTRLHARGGIGQVWLARDFALERDVALKELRSDRVGQAAAINRFVQEARITGRLTHPAIVPVYALGWDVQNRPFYVMKFVRGQTLAEAIRAHHTQSTPPGFQKLLRHFGDVCQAIAYSHSQGVLHRDLKPQNIMLGEYGETLVVDWGLAKEVRGPEPAAAAEPPIEPHLTRAGDILGTPAYMSPEQATGQAQSVGPATDIYALGVILYEILTGRLPYSATSDDELLIQVRQGAIIPPSSVAADVPTGLATVCLKAIAHRPEDRYATANELARQVENWLAEELDRSQTALRRQSRLLQAILDQMPAIVWTTDTKLCITHTAGAGLVALNIRPEDLIGMSLMEYLERDSPLATPIAAHMAALRGESLDYSMEWLSRHFQVRVEPLRKEDGNISGSIGVVFDITARKLAEDALRQSEERYRRLVDTARDLVITLSPEFIITSMNPAFDTITGLSGANHVGQALQPLVHPEDWIPVRKLLERSLRGETPPICEARLRRHENDWVRTELLMTPQKQADKFTGILGIVRDITERQQLESEFRKAQKMEALAQLAGGIAHDLNNLMAPVIMSSQLALQMLKEENLSDVRQVIEIVRSVGERGAAWARQVLSYSRGLVLNLQVVDLNEILTDLTALLRQLVGQDINLIVQNDSMLRHVRSDRALLERAIVNLVVNARDAMSNGGRLTLTTSNVSLDETFVRLHAEMRAGPYALLEVRDTGCGMTPETQARLFEPLYTTKRSGGNMGLGLAMVHGIVKQSKGHILVESTPNKGTIIRLYLPQCEATSSVIKTEPSELSVTERRPTA